jgi:hypothetical protein
LRERRLGRGCFCFISGKRTGFLFWEAADVAKKKPAFVVVRLKWKPAQVSIFFGLYVGK